MAEVSFDTQRDLLFVGGDNVDRGPNSAWVLEYINEPWFISVAGNHEEMFLCAYESGLQPEGYPSRMLRANGGEWVFEDTNGHHLDAAYESFLGVPLAIELILPNKRLGIIRAEVAYGDWARVKSCGGVGLEMDAQAIAQWARTKYDRQIQTAVKNIDEVYVGHTPTDSLTVETFGNVHYCDLGCFFSGSLAFVEIK